MSGQKATRDGFGEAIAEIGRNKGIVVLDADLAESTRSIKFKEKYPERYFDLKQIDYIIRENLKNKYTDWIIFVIPIRLKVLKESIIIIYFLTVTEADLFYQSTNHIAL